MARRFSATFSSSSTRSNSTNVYTKYAESENGHNKLSDTTATNLRRKDVSKVDLSNLTVVKRSNKLIQTMNLPIIANINPRSIYNKVNEFKTFVEQKEVDIIFMSESWEREEKT